MNKSSLAMISTWRWNVASTYLVFFEYVSRVIFQVDTSGTAGFIFQSQKLLFEIILRLANPLLVPIREMGTNKIL